MLMASHVDAIHTGNAIIAVPTVATGFFFITHPVHKARFIQQGASHLHKLESVIQYFIYLLTRYQAAYIY